MWNNKLSEPDIAEPDVKPAPTKPIETPIPKEWEIERPYPKHYPQPTPKGLAFSFVKQKLNKYV